MKGFDIIDFIIEKAERKVRLYIIGLCIGVLILIGEIYYLIKKTMI